ncbi:MAG: methyltransferase domain-containing protein [Tepidisphaeraceae bacterium]
MPAPLSQRRRQHEWMDADDVDPRELARSLRFIRWVNVAFGFTRATLSHLDRFSRRWRPGQTVHILDVATGSADVPLAILRWAAQRGHDVRIVGIDRHAKTAREALRIARDPRLSIIQADALCLPFDDASFDYALTGMFLHHLDDADVVRALAEMNRASKRGVIVADILRNRRALAWIKLLTLPCGAMVRHDAAVSVVQAFTRDEIIGLAERAGIGFVRYHRHFGHRFVLAGERSI